MAVAAAGAATTWALSTVDLLKREDLSLSERCGLRMDCTTVSSAASPLLEHKPMPDLLARQLTTTFLHDQLAGIDRDALH
jgi:hypothetical protein